MHGDQFTVNCALALRVTPASVHVTVSGSAATAAGAFSSDDRKAA